MGSSGVGCGKGIVLYSRHNLPHPVWPKCGWLWHHNLLQFNYKTCYLSGGFVVGLWCKCGGVTTTCPELGLIRATLLPHSDHTVWWKCMWRGRINREVIHWLVSLLRYCQSTMSWLWDEMLTWKHPHSFMSWIAQLQIILFCCGRMAPTWLF